MDSFARCDAERLRCRADVFAPAILDIENITPRWQCDTITAIPVCGHTRDFLFSVLAQNNQRIFGIISGAELLRVSLSELNLFECNNF